MPIILGIDPGSRLTGYGFVEVNKGGEPVHVSSGVVRTESKRFTERLAEIFQALDGLVREFQPAEVAVEEVFLSTNPQSALKLGQARGAAIVAAVQYRLPVFEYSARQVKQAIVGYGAAQKHQMQMMVRHHLRLKFLPQSDQADALAVALCHHQVRLSPLATTNHDQLKSHSGTSSARGRRTAMRKWAEKRYGKQITE